MYLLCPLLLWSQEQLYFSLRWTDCFNKSYNTASIITPTQTWSSASSLAKRPLTGLCHPGFFGDKPLQLDTLFSTSGSLCNVIRVRPAPSGALSYSLNESACVCMQMTAFTFVCVFNRSADPGRTSPRCTPSCPPCRVTPSTGWGKHGRTLTGLGLKIRNCKRYL